jgi:hypothetical protein
MTETAPRGRRSLGQATWFWYNATGVASWRAVVATAALSVTCTGRGRWTWSVCRDGVDVATGEAPGMGPAQRAAERAARDAVKRT